MLKIPPFIPEGYREYFHARGPRVCFGYPYQGEDTEHDWRWTLGHNLVVAGALYCVSQERHCDPPLACVNNEFCWFHSDG